MEPGQGRFFPGARISVVDQSWLPVTRSGICFSSSRSIFARSSEMYSQGKMQRNLQKHWLHFLFTGCIRVPFLSLNGNSILIGTCVMKREDAFYDIAAHGIQMEK